MATSTAEAVGQIQNTISQVQNAFDSLTKDAQNMLGFVVNDVTPDYSNFVEVAKQYGEDAASIERTAENISNMSDNIKQIMQEVTAAVQSIAEATQDTTEVSGNMTEKVVVVADHVDNVSEMAEKEDVIARELTGVVSRFKLEEKKTEKTNMSEQEHKVLKEQRNRRKRVQHIRIGIITVISVWMILSIVITCILCAKVVSLQKQINILTGDYDSSTAVSAKVNQSASDTADIKLTQNTSDKENLATAEDLHKVYLTFDDGPSDNTNAILDVLDDYNVKATFFVTGKEDEASKAAYKRIVDEGHTIAMHSYSHKYSDIYASKEAFQNDF